ncbi:hypothetical protein [Geothrix alkalitolerans]|uniref:hypothetical protein n=1 Tax=Geothrix alkalitolerans TaxID=2922724 RepID=UPI001FAEDA68|nr:hypothetical protein [Geothrix alkalitolerans]
MSDEDPIDPFDSEARPSLAGFLVDDSLYTLLVCSIIPFAIVPILLIDHYFPAMSQFALGAIALLSIAAGVIVALLVIRYIKKSHHAKRPPSA